MSNGKLMSGQQFRPEDDHIVRFTEQMMDDTAAAELLDDPRTEITPNDAASSLVRVYTPPTAAITAFSLVTPARASVVLPDVLTGIDVTYSSTNSSGESSEDGEGIAVGTTPNLSLSIQARSQGSASIIPDVQPAIRQTWSQNVPVVQYLFYLATPTLANILTRVSALAGASVLAWPVFRPISHTITLTGKQLSLSLNANVQQHVSINSSNNTVTRSQGRGFSGETGLTVRTIRIPPTIHGLITIVSGDLPTSSFTVEAEAVLTGGTNYPSLSETPAPLSGEVEPVVFPTSLAATNPVAIPTTGLYLHNLNVRRYLWGYSLVEAEVFDFASIV